MQVNELPIGRYKKVVFFLRNGKRVRANNGRILEKKGKKYFKCWKPENEELKDRRSSAIKSFSPETKVLRCEMKRRRK
jgi:hypothetical protein